MKITNFEDFTEKNIVKYSDYDVSNLSMSEMDSSVLKPIKKIWAAEEKHPWTKEQYEKLTHPDVKREISYEEYMRMWNERIKDEYRLDNLPPEITLVPPTPKVRPDNAQSRSTAKAKLVKPTNPYMLNECGGAAYSNICGGICYGPSGTSGAPGSFVYNDEPKKPLKTIVKSAPYLSSDPSVPSDSDTRSSWSKLRPEQRISIIIGIVGLVLSFLTLLSLILK